MISIFSLQHSHHSSNDIHTMSLKTLKTDIELATFMDGNHFRYSFTEKGDFICIDYQLWQIIFFQNQLI